MKDRLSIGKRNPEDELIDNDRASGQEMRAAPEFWLKQLVR